ncbi:MAG TPA: DUF4149 domain-containing protein [Terriglobales bacterium]|nr:DUF4149 domain-containing protein [Terriglobales bacterium]
MTFIRFLLLLSLAVWLGALIFFPVVAQTSFEVLPSAHLAGFVVRDSLIKLHWMGLVCGIVFLICSVIYNHETLGRARIFAASHMLIGAMLILTAISQFGIIPRMDLLRITAGEIDLFSPSNPIRAQFDSLHAWSVLIEEAVLLLAMIVLYLTARRWSSPCA